jgi:cobalt-zinc-cadmium efflux system outer membrane protein
MKSRRWDWGLALSWSVLVLGLPRQGWAQAPTIEQTGMVSGGASSITPGSMDSLLGPMPGSSGVSFGMQPGRDDMLLGRIGTSAPRVPTSITTPGGIYQGPPPAEVFAAQQPRPVPRAPFFGTLELPKHEEEEGPLDGLTLDQAIDLLKRQNLDLLAKYYEIPQARADVLTASLRANPIFYADSQLVPYGSDSNRRPGGPTQYDVNFSQPIDWSHKRWARMAYAARALQVMEAQYQNEVRLTIQNLYIAYVDVLAARETVRYVLTSIRGLNENLRVNQLLFQRSLATSADVDQAKSDRAIADSGLLDAEETLRQKKRILAEILNIHPDQAEQIELRGTIGDLAPPPPPQPELIRIANDSRPDIAAYKLGIAAAEANVKLQLANRYSDAYLLMQPYTFQNNAPFGKESATSWAVGMTIPLPVFNRNQGNIQRAQFNVEQSRIQLTGLERRIISEIQQAWNEYRVTGMIRQQLYNEVLSASGRVVKARERLFDEGEVAKVIFLDAQRRYNENAKSYLDSLVRHRRSMLTLNTVVGQRILP